ncbi:MAG: hypothetical protein R3C99_08680 [Pirellulaceae bacterium]
MNNGYRLIPKWLGRSRRRAAARQFDLPTSAATIVLMYPVVKYLLTHIGLPWLHELGRYNELQRTRVHRWIDEAYRDEGFDPDQAEAASDRLIAELESTTNGQARESWERLLALLKAGGDASCQAIVSKCSRWRRSPDLAETADRRSPRALGDLRS